MCQTALALAKYHAHGKIHANIPTPEAVVTLDVSHFQVVRDAYVEFTEYMNELYKADATQRARENYLRAARIDESNEIVLPMAAGGTFQDRKQAEFLLAAQGPSLASHAQQSPPPPPHQQHYPYRYQSQQPQQPQQYQQQQEYYHYQNLNVPRSAYSESSYGQPQTQHLPAGQGLNYTGGPVGNTSFQGPGEEEQNILPLQQQQRPPLTTTLHQQHSQENVQQQVINRGVYSMFESAGQQLPNQHY